MNRGSRIVALRVVPQRREKKRAAVAAEAPRKISKPTEKKGKRKTANKKKPRRK